MTFFRYPGGKSKLKKPILNTIEKISQGKNIKTYIEPFFGGGSICFALLEQNIFPSLEEIYISDVDSALIALWRAVHSNPDALIDMINSFTPSVESFYVFKSILEYDTDIDIDDIDIGFKKLAVHQMSFSGLGVKAGGPIGGVNQSSAYDVGCRWSTKSMIKKINKCHDLLNRYSTSINKMGYKIPIYFFQEDDSFMYLDPPYYDKGEDLYQFAFTAKDHRELKTALNDFETSWLLSYDSHDMIKEIYADAIIEEISINYTIKTARKKTELLIYPSAGRVIV